MNRADWCRLMDGLAKTQPWTWVSLIYATHVLVIFPMAHLMGVGWREMITPFVLLLLGLAGGLALRGTRQGQSRPRWQASLPALLYAAFIFSLSAKSFEGVSVPVDTDVFHPIEYLLLAVFLCCVWPPTGEWPTALRRSLVPVLACGCLFALSDEFHQAFVPGRSANLGDLGLDLLGLLVGWGLCRVLLMLREHLWRCFPGRDVKAVLE